MTNVTTERSGILRQDEIISTLDKSREVGPWLTCLIALAWAFGKRISELLKVQAEDIRTDDQFLYVNFYVSKKRKKTQQGIPREYLKRITLQHPSVPFILDYWQEVKTGPLFNVSQQLARYYLKKANKQAWWHLFRHSLATEMAEHGADVLELVNWFDWDKPTQPSTTFSEALN